MVILDGGERVRAIAPSEDVLWIGEDGSCLLQTGAIQYPSGSQTTIEGIIRMSSGEMQEALWPLLPYGTVLLPTGTLVLPNGSLKFADGCCMLGMKLQLSKLGGDKIVTLREESVDNLEDGTRLIDGTSQLSNGSIRLPSGCVTLINDRHKLLSPNQEVFEAVYELPPIKHDIGPIVMPNYEWNSQAHELYVMQLHRAAQSARFPKVLSCLKSGCDPNTRDKFGNTPLHLTPCITTALILVEYGARLDAMSESEPSRAAIDLFVYENCIELADAALKYLRTHKSKWDDFEEYKAYLKQMLPSGTSRDTIVYEKKKPQSVFEESKSLLTRTSGHLDNVPTLLSLSLSCTNLVALKPKTQPLCSTMIGVYLLDGDGNNPSSRLVGQTEWVMHAINPQFERRVVLNSKDAKFSHARLRFSVHDCDKTKVMQPSNLIGEVTLRVDDILARSKLELVDEDIGYLYGSDDENDNELDTRRSVVMNKPVGGAIMCSELIVHPTDAKLQHRLNEAQATVFVQTNIENNPDMSLRKTTTTEFKRCRPGSMWIDLIFQCENMPPPGKTFPGYKIVVLSRIVNKQKGFQFLGHTDWVSDASNPTFQNHIKLGHNVSEPMVLKIMVYSHPYKTEKEFFVGQSLVVLQSLLSKLDSQESYRLRNQNDHMKHKLLKNQAATVSMKFQATPIGLFEEAEPPSRPLEMGLSVQISSVPNRIPFQGTPSVAILQQQQLAGCRYDIMAPISKNSAIKWSTPSTQVNLPARMNLSDMPADTKFRIDVHDAKSALHFVESEQIGSVPLSLEEILTFHRPKELVSSTKEKSALSISVIPTFFGQMDVTISCRNLVKIGTFASHCDPVAVVFRNDDGSLIGKTERQKQSLHPSFQNTVRVTGDRPEDWQIRVMVFSANENASSLCHTANEELLKNKIGSAVVDLTQLAHQRDSSFFSYPLTSHNKTMSRRLQDRSAELCVTLSLVGQQKQQRSVKPEAMHGMLTKRGGTKRSWQKRHVSLHSGILSYWDSKDKAPRGQLSVWGAHVYTYTNPTKGMRRVFSIKAVGSERIFYFQTAELAERARWCKALQDHGALMRQLVDDSFFKGPFGKVGESPDQPLN